MKAIFEVKRKKEAHKRHTNTMRAFVARAIREESL